MELPDEAMVKWSEGFDAGANFMTHSFSHSMIDNLLYLNGVYITALGNQLARLKRDQKIYYDGAHPETREGEYAFWMLNKVRSELKTCKERMRRAVSTQRRLKQLSRDRMELDRDVERNRFNG